MSILEAMKRDNMYMRPANFTLFNKYEPRSSEYFKATITLFLTDIDTPWQGVPGTGEVYWGNWSRNKYKRGNFLRVFL